MGKLQHYDDEVGTLSIAETVTTNPYDVLMAQFISPTLDGAQTISGTLKGQMCAEESNSLADFCSQLTAYVVSGDGLTVRGVLLAHDTSALSSEWATADTNRKFPRGGAQTVTNVSASDGDRIVIEVGYRSHNTVSTSRSGILTWGTARQDLEMDVDLPEDETDTNNLTKAAWFEFSLDIVFDTSLRATQEVVEVGAAVAEPELRFSQEVIEVGAALAEPELRFSQLIIEVAASIVGHGGWGWGPSWQEV